MTNYIKLVTTTTINYEIEADSPLEALDKLMLLPSTERVFFEAEKLTTETKIFMQLDTTECE
jgi:hypothetical protein